MAAGSPYTEGFFEHDLSGSFRSAQRIAPIIADLVRPRSVLDVGCGAGAFLKAFSELGVVDFLGVDGDYVPRAKLHIDALRFLAADLAKPFRLDRKFDLVMSLEVAEHLPKSAAPVFVQSLVEHGDVVLFSAAVPGQGGVNHINEQWPSYWAQLFATHGFQPYDLIRPRIWADTQVEWWYRQNCIVFGRPAKLGQFAWAARSESPSHLGLNVVHPVFYLLKQQQFEAMSGKLNGIQATLATGRTFAVDRKSDGKVVVTKLS